MSAHRLLSYINLIKKHDINHAILRWIAWTGIISTSMWGLCVMDDDIQHGSLVRILLIHVPASWGALACYSVMALTSGLGLIYRSFAALNMAHAFAWPGFIFSLISIATGMIWGKPAWGTWWVWDARLTSMLILAFLYGAFLHFAADRKTMTTAGLVAVIGWVNIPLIKGSVNWWATLHQKPSVTILGGNALDMHYAWPLATMTVSWVFFTFAWAVRWYSKKLPSHQRWSNT